LLSPKDETARAMTLKVIDVPGNNHKIMLQTVAAIRPSMTGNGWPRADAPR
jgi:hypothetical protein